MLSFSKAFPPILAVALVICIGECCVRVKSSLFQRNEIFYGNINIDEDLCEFMLQNNARFDLWFWKCVRGKCVIVTFMRDAQKFIRNCMLWEGSRCMCDVSAVGHHEELILFSDFWHIINILLKCPIFSNQYQFRIIISSYNKNIFEDNILSFRFMFLVQISTRYY